LKFKLESALAIGLLFKPMNLRMLSELLGLSQTTVSRALNGFPEVSEETRTRVKAAADLHGYRPSPAARRLATGQSGTLGVVFPRERNMLGDLIFTEFLGACVEKASELGYDITLGMASGIQSEENVYRRAVRSARVDAMIVSSPLIEDTRIDLLRSLKMPFLLHGRTKSTLPCPFLDIDNEGAFYKASRLLCDLGHERIALIDGDLRHNFAVDRERGYRKALGESGIVPDPMFVRGGPMNEHHGHDEASRLLKLNMTSRPTAFLCSSLAQASGVQRAAREMGLRIGPDISLIAHDDRLHEFRAESFDPPLTATQSSIGEAGARVVELLIAHLRDPSAELPAEVWPVDLVVRSSTAPVKQA
jgi:LacI family transcriptional regulator